MMDVIKIQTEFAPAERASDVDVNRQRRLFRNLPMVVTRMLDAVPNMLVVLNRERQVVYANQSLYDLLKIEPDRVDQIFGARPGEILKCTHAFESPGGCGTTRFCSTCGAIKAILVSQENRRDVQECRITQYQKGDALDFRVWAKPLLLDGENFTVLTMLDISHEKRREALERIFFHDILNTAGGLKGLAELIRDADQEELTEFRDTILRLANDLIEEITAQRQLSAAEMEDLTPCPSLVETIDILEETANQYTAHEVARGRRIQIDGNAYRGALTTDRSLLRRVLGNMTKNALEASGTGDTVTMGCELDEKGTAFWVHNPGFVSQEVQLQIFQRSFSTKGSGRGLGTYSIKLLAERYLNGHASFGTSPKKGTVFRVVVPDMPINAIPVPDRSFASETHKPSARRILVAEDNPVNQKLVCKMLERLGHEAVFVGDGKAALSALSLEPFDLVLMDCQMPEMDGFEAARMIRKESKVKNAGIPIVAMTGFTGKESREACLTAGMNDHVAKPVGKETLVEILARWT